MDHLPFSLISTEKSTSARVGQLNLKRGLIHTPCFMPIGTHAAIKTLAPWEVQELGAQIILSNTYHLYLRPGMDLIQQYGGLHRFMGWSGPILTDSGGYQVFSLAALRKLDDDGVSFQSHLDGSTHYLTPEKSVDIQRILGSDFVMALDECPPGNAHEREIAKAVSRTTLWAQRCLERFRITEETTTQIQHLFLIIQGGTSSSLRRKSADDLMNLNGSAYAIGGLAVGEPKEELFSILELMDELLPKDKPRYLMGVGTPADLVQSVALGVDMFDCVLPTRNARNGQLFTTTGTLNIRNSRYRSDLRPIQEGCDCLLCTRFERAYLSHLFHSGEVLGLRLATMHNLRFYLKLMASMREAIEQENFSSWSNQFLAEYNENSA